MSNRLESDRESRLAQSYSEHNVLTRVQDVRTTRKDGSDNQVRHNLDYFTDRSSSCSCCCRLQVSIAVYQQKAGYKALCIAIFIDNPRRLRQGPGSQSY
jgi:hypothetical protein